MPPFPEEIHLREGVRRGLGTLGDEAAASARHAAVLDALPEPLLHGVGRCRAPDLQGRSTPLYPQGEQWYWRADFVKDIPDEAVAMHAAGGAAADAESTMHLYPIDGAAHDVAPGTRAWRYRDARWARSSSASTPTGDVERDPASGGRLPGGAAPVLRGRRLREHDDGGGPGRVRATYGDNYERLTRIKAKYDPDNLFRVNQNIPPAEQPC